MPMINFEGPKLSHEKKAELAKKITTVCCEVLPHIPVEAFVMVIHENDLDNFAVGGKLVSDK